MDIQKAMQAINAAQNASDKVKPFLNLVDTLNACWEAMKDINPDELIRLMEQKKQLSAEMDSLSASKANLAADFGALQDKHNAKVAELTSQYDALRKQLESAHATYMASLNAQATEAEQKAKTAADQAESNIRSLASKRDQLEVQIAQLKNLANSVVHA